MSQRIKAIVYAAHGKPEEVLRLEEQPRPEPTAHQALVRLLAAPINPADLNQIEGKYPIRAPLPATPGFEGAGVIETVGAEVKDHAAGELVILPHDIGTWREMAVVEAGKLTTAPNDIAPEQAALLKINPITAWRLLHDFVTLQPGEWVVQNAANSAVGRAVIAICRALGWRTVNVVRREELIEELRAEGGDVVLLDNDALREAVAQATERAAIRLGINQVGGESALRLAKVVAREAVIVTIGAMSLKPLTMPNGLLIFKNLRFTGFWVNKWYEHRARWSGRKRSRRFSIWRGGAYSGPRLNGAIRCKSSRRRSRAPRRVSARARSYLRLRDSVAERAGAAFVEA